MSQLGPNYSTFSFTIQLIKTSSVNSICRLIIMKPRERYNISIKLIHATYISQTMRKSYNNTVLYAKTCQHNSGSKIRQSVENYVSFGSSAAYHLQTAFV